VGLAILGLARDVIYKHTTVHKNENGAISNVPFCDSLTESAVA